MKCSNVIKTLDITYLDKYTGQKKTKYQIKTFKQYKGTIYNRNQ